jgi:hypothetical protein
MATFTNKIIENINFPLDSYKLLVNYDPQMLQVL